MKCQLSPQSWKGNPTTNGMGLNWNPTERGYLHVFDCIKDKIFSKYVNK